MDLTPLDELARRPGMPELLAALGPGNARFVGGAVRDRLLGIAVQDIDLATTLSPYEVMRRCGAAAIRTVPTGIEHGTVTALVDGRPVEITSLRADVSTDGRRATVAFSDDWRTDAERRDFTLNALYWDPGSGLLDDWFGGLDDLAAGVVRFIGEPLRRIAEDHLRILRFFRFHARFGRGEPDPSSLAACAVRANDLMALSRERIADELLKILALPDPAPTIAQMIDQAIWRAVLPEFDHSGSARLAALVASEIAAAVAPDPLRRLAALIAPDPELADKIAFRLKLSNKRRKRLGIAASWKDTPGPTRKLAYQIGSEGAIDRLLLGGDIPAARDLASWEVPRLALGGGELIRRGLVPGPGVAAMLRQIEQSWVDEGFPNEKRLAQLVDEALAAH